MLEVLKSGFFTTVQDFGRRGYQRHGVGVAGALDPFALAAANILAGNPADAAGLEITIIGPTIKFHEETLFALAGADLDARLNNRPIANWTSHLALPGSLLSFGGRKSGARAYLAVCGGIDVPPVMGSRSTYLLGRFGGLNGRALKAMDRLSIGPALPNLEERAGRLFPENLRPAYVPTPTLRVVIGPFAEYLSPEGISSFLTGEYQILPQSDRMGYRLQGPAISRSKQQELVTCGLANGTIQVPPNGQPIILLADRQTIGGYPIIATMIHADLPLIAQCAPGDRLRFAMVSADEGREAYLRLWENLKRQEPTPFSEVL